jgi:type IV pilus assembly protein PilO
MPKRIIAGLARWRKDPRVLVRLVLAVLLAANLVAAAVAFKPWAASVEDLDRQAASLRQQLRQREAALDKMRAVVDKVQKARTQGDSFMEKYLLATRSVASTLSQDLEQMARKAGVRQKDTTFSYEPAEGSDSLTKVTVTALYEGAYADLMHFLNLLDRADRVLIVESLGAAPQQSGTLLGITMKLSAFIREGGEPPAIAETQTEPENTARVVEPPPQMPRAVPASNLPPAVAAPTAAPPAPVAAPPRWQVPRVRLNRAAQ